MPTVVELKTILDVSNCNGGLGPCIDPTFGPADGDYWTSTSSPNAADIAWYVSFADGSSNVLYKPFDLPVRAVRGP